MEAKLASKIHVIQEREGNFSCLFFSWVQEDVAMRREQTKIKDFMEAKNIAAEWKFILEIIKKNWISDVEHNVRKMFANIKKNKWWRGRERKKEKRETEKGGREPFLLHSQFSIMHLFSFFHNKHDSHQLKFPEVSIKVYKSKCTYIIISHRRKLWLERDYCIIEMTG